MKPVNEKIQSKLIGASVDLSRVEESVRLDIRKMLERLRHQLTGEIQDRMGKQGTAFSQARLDQLLSATNTAIDATYKEIAVDMSAKLASLARVQTAVAAQAVNSSVGAVLLDTTFNAAQLKTLVSSALIEGAPSAEWWARAAKSTREKFADNVRQGMLRGESVQQIVQRVQAPGTGMMSKTTKQAEALVRTSVQTVANTVRQEIYKQNEELFNGIQWVSTLDNRTTEICQALDGLQWDNDLEPIGHDQPFPGPTAHWGCRSTQIPILKSWKELIDDPKLAEALDKAEAETPGMRASMTGEAPAKQTYEEWLKEQPVETQIDILGPGKWQMWQEGKLYWSEMVDPTGRPLTLKELEAQHNLTGSSVGAASVADMEALASETNSVGALDALAKQIKDNPASAALENIAAGKAPQGIGQLAMSMLYEGKTEAQVMAAIAEKYPGSKTSSASMSWYKSKVKALKVLKNAEAELASSLKKAQEAVKAVTKLDAAIPASLAQEAAAAAAAEPVKKGGMGIGNLTVKLIKEGKSNAEILAEIKSVFPNAKSSNATINWYKNKLKSLTAQELSGGGLPKGIHSKAKAVHTASTSALKSGADDLASAMAKIQTQPASALGFSESMYAEINKAAQKEFGTVLYVPKSAVKSAIDDAYLKYVNEFGINQSPKAWAYAIRDAILEAAKKEGVKTAAKAPGIGAAGATQNVLQSGIPPDLYEAAKKYSKKAWGYEVQIPASYKYDPAEAKKIAAKFGISNDPAGELAKALNQAYLKEHQAEVAAKAAQAAAEKKAKEEAFLKSLEGPTPMPKGHESFKELAYDAMREVEREFKKIFDGLMTNVAKFAQSEIAAIQSYSGSAYTSINGNIRSAFKQSGAISISSNTARSLQSGLMKTSLKADTRLFRGIKQGDPITNELWKIIKETGSIKNLIGKTLFDPAFQSTSFRRQFADGWGGSKGVLLEILAPKGTPGAAIDFISRNSGENEFILPVGTRFLVRQAEYIKSGWGGGYKLKLVVELVFPKGVI